MRLELNARGSWAVVGEFPAQQLETVRRHTLHLAIALRDRGPAWRITNQDNGDAVVRALAYLDPRKGFAWSDE